MYSQQKVALRRFVISKLKLVRHRIQSSSLDNSESSWWVWRKEFAILGMQFTISLTSYKSGSATSEVADVSNSYQFARRLTAVKIDSEQDSQLHSAASTIVTSIHRQTTSSKLAQALMGVLEKFQYIHKKWSPSWRRLWWCTMPSTSTCSSTVLFSGLQSNTAKQYQVVSVDDCLERSKQGLTV